MSKQSSAFITLREEINPPSTLDDRIADAFDSVMTSDDLNSLLGEVDQAGADAIAQSKAAADRALDPKVRPSEVTEARHQMEDANFRSSRMDAAAEQLKDLFSKALSREARQRAAEEYSAAKAERDQIVNDLAEYEEHASAIVKLLSRLAKNDARISKANTGQSADTWLYSAQRIARGAQHDFGVHHDQRLPDLIGAVRLPNFRINTTSTHGNLWPPAPGTF